MNREKNLEEDELDRDLARYMKSLTDTFARFEDGLKRHEAFGKQLLLTVGKVNSQKLDVFEILKMLTKEVNGLSTRLNQMKEEIDILKSRDVDKEEKGAIEPTGYRSHLGGGNNLLDIDTDDIYLRSKKAFSQIDSMIDEKATPQEDQRPTEYAEFRDGAMLRESSVEELKQTLSKINDRKKNAMEALKENGDMVVKLEGRLDAIRGEPEVMHEGERSDGDTQRNFALRAKPGASAAPGNDLSFDIARPDSGGEHQESRERKATVLSKLEEGEKAIKLYRLKENILRQKIDIYKNESTKIEQEINGAKDKEETLLGELNDFLVRIRKAIDMPDGKREILTGSDSSIRSSKI